jgi:hypothetical protein
MTTRLSNDVHDVRCHDSFVSLSSLNLAQTEKLLDDEDQKVLLGVLVWKNGGRKKGQTR